jgi:MFS family permease
LQNSPHIAEPPLKPETPFYYGWVVMPVAALMVVGTLPGQTVVVSQFNTSIRESLGIGNDALAFAYLIGTLCAAVPLTLVGKLSDRIGPRRTAGLVVGSFLLGILALTNAAGLVSLTIGFFLIRFLGQGALGMLSSHVLALWFERRLATVESIKHAAISLAGAVVPALVLVLINEFGWRRAYAVLGIAVAAVLLPLIEFVLRDRPEEIGQHLDAVVLAADRAGRAVGIGGHGDAVSHPADPDRGRAGRAGAGGGVGCGVLVGGDVLRIGFGRSDRGSAAAAGDPAGGGAGHGRVGVGVAIDGRAPAGGHRDGDLRAVAGLGDGGGGSGDRAVLRPAPPRLDPGLRDDRDGRRHRDRALSSNTPGADAGR